jgi:hypothetical protein
MHQLNNKKPLLKNYFTTLYPGLLLSFSVIFLSATPGKAQLRPREVNHQAQFWWSLNTTARIADKWMLVGDVHIRRNNGIRDPSFYFLRAGFGHQLLPNFNLTAGYAHMWIAPSLSDWQTFVNENRLYQQAILTQTVGKVALLTRLRNEQRWQQIIVDDKPSGKWRFTNRVRYLLSTTIPVSKNKWVPRPVVSNELLIHFGKAVAYNVFDQNRIFIGIRQQVSKSLSFDFGYMNVYQQKFSGYQYDMNHTTRLFFYYNPNWTRHKLNKQIPTVHSPDE